MPQYNAVQYNVQQYNSVLGPQPSLIPAQNRQYNNIVFNGNTYNALESFLTHYVRCHGGYNEQMYNTSVYNCGDPFEFVTVLDATLIKDISLVLSDFVIIDEFLSKQITAKVIAETVRLADWLSKKQNPQSNDWGD